MPYIEEDNRDRYNKALERIPEIRSKGDLEYCIFYLQKLFMSSRSWRFSNIHEAVYGAIHCGDEFRRRYLDKREDQARETNGDVLPEIKPPWEDG